MHNVQIIIPAHNNSGESLAPVLEQTKRNLCALFGGYTAWEAQGGWVSDAGDLYEEAVVMISSSVSDLQEAQMIIAIARNVLDITDQLAVFVSIDGKASIIE